MKVIAFYRSVRYILMSTLPLSWKLRHCSYRLSQNLVLLFWEIRSIFLNFPASKGTLGKWNKTNKTNKKHSLIRAESLRKLQYSRFSESWCGAVLSRRSFVELTEKSRAVQISIIFCRYISLITTCLVELAVLLLFEIAFRYHSLICNFDASPCQWQF